MTSYRLVMFLFAVLFVHSPWTHAQFLDAVLNDHAERVGKARDQYEKQLSQSKRIAINKLEPLATTAVRKGELAQANKIWLEVLRLELQHTKAREHFQSLGLLDKAMSQIGSSSNSRHLLEAKLVNSKWSWPYKSERFSVNFATEGKAYFYKSVQGRKPDSAGKWKVIGPQTVQVIFSNTYVMVFNVTATKFTCHAEPGSGHDGGVGERLK